MIKIYTLKTFFVVSNALFFSVGLFSQVAVVGFAVGQAYIDKPEFPEYTTTTFPSSLQIDKLTHVIAADIGCRNNGSLFTGKLPNSWQGTPPPDNIWNGSKNQWLVSLINRAHTKGLNASISVGGDYFIEATDNTNINAFVGNIVSFVNVHGFDGVNINWEYPTNADEWNQCIALLNSLKDNLPSEKRITIALSHATHAYDSIEYIPQQILSIVDGIYLMTYDEGDPAWPNHSGAARSIQAINEWISWGTPTCEQKKKLFLGNAFYGWHPVVGEQQGGERVSYRDYILNNDTRWNSNPGDVPADVTNKATHCLNNGYGGVFIWELGYDLSATNPQSLLNAIYEAITPVISGPYMVCSSGSSYSIQNLPPGVMITWNQSSYLERVSSQGSNPCTFKATEYGYGWIEASINSGCGTIAVPRKNLTSDKPGISPLHDPNCSYCQVAYGYVGTTYMIAAQTDNPSTYNYDYYWEIYPPEGSGWEEGYVDYGKYIYYAAPVAGTYIFKLRQNWSCGWSTFSEVERVFYGGYGLSFTPNPATGITKLTITAAGEETVDESLEWELEVYNHTLLLIEKKTWLKGSSTVINTSGWQGGIYLVRVKFGGEILTGKLVVKK